MVSGTPVSERRTVPPRRNLFALEAIFSRAIAMFFFGFNLYRFLDSFIKLVL